MSDEDQPEDDEPTTLPPRRPILRAVDADKLREEEGTEKKHLQELWERSRAVPPAPRLSVVRTSADELRETRGSDVIAFYSGDPTLVIVMLSDELVDAEQRRDALLIIESRAHTWIRITDSTGGRCKPAQEGMDLGRGSSPDSVIGVLHSEDLTDYRGRLAAIGM